MKYKTIGIKQKMILNFIVFIILPIIIFSLCLLGYYGVILQNKISLSTEQVLAQTANHIQSVIDSSVVASSLLCMDPQAASDLNTIATANSSWQQYESTMYIHKRIKEIQNATLYNYNAKIAVMDFCGNFYTDNTLKFDPRAYQEMRKRDWYKRVIEANGFVMWEMQQEKDAAQLMWDKEDITLSRLIKGGNPNGGYGILMVTFAKQDFNKILATNCVSPNGITAVIDSNNQVLAASSQAELLTTLQSDSFMRYLSENTLPGSYRDKGERILVNAVHIPNTQWRLVSLLPYRVVMSELTQLNINVCLFYLGILIVFVLLTIYISHNITQPIRVLEQSMLSLQKGDFNVRSNIRGYRELENLSNSFNTTVVEMERLVQQVEEETVKQQQAKLEALQAQINPHFLVNTLNGIRWMANMSGSQNVAQQLSHLGKLLQGSIYNTAAWIALKDEIEYLDAYIELQRMRFGNQFEVRYELPPELMSCAMPPFILQPIIENSIIHGVGNSGGVILISGERCGDYLCLVVTDNGVGIPPDVLEQLLVKSTAHRGQFSGIGLVNVHERIRLTFGKNCGLTISSEMGKGTSIRILMRYHKMEEHREGGDE